MAAQHNGVPLAPAAPPVYVIDGRELYHQVSTMAASMVRTETLLAAHLQAERDERQERREERDTDEARFAALERRVWAIPGAGTLIALAGIGLTIMSLKGG